MEHWVVSIRKMAVIKKKFCIVLVICPKMYDVWVNYQPENLGDPEKIRGTLDFFLRLQMEYHLLG